MSAALQHHAHVHPAMAAVLHSIFPARSFAAIDRDQAFFDKSLAHIRQQGRASASPVHPDRPMKGRTFYRSENGDTCTIGCHIEPHQYSLCIEGVGVASVMKEHPYIARAMGWPSVELAELVQCAHDFVLVHFGMEAFEENMAAIARGLGLYFTPKVTA